MFSLGAFSLTSKAVLLELDIAAKWNSDEHPII